MPRGEKTKRLWQNPAYSARLRASIRAARKKQHAGKPKAKVTITCQCCGEAFEVWKYRETKAKYCSRKCVGLATYDAKRPSLPGRKLSEATKEKMAIRMMGNSIAEGHVPWNLGHPHLAGEKHWNWKGGITDEKKSVRNSREYQAWRRSVYRRDWFRCQMPGCGSKKKIEAHHIRKFETHPDLILEKDNGITLCHCCHMSIRHREHEYVELFAAIVASKPAPKSDVQSA